MDPELEEVTNDLIFFLKNRGLFNEWLEEYGYTEEQIDSIIEEG